MSEGREDAIKLVRALLSPHAHACAHMCLHTPAHTQFTNRNTRHTAQPHEIIYTQLHVHAHIDTQLYIQHAAEMHSSPGEPHIH